MKLNFPSSVKKLGIVERTFWTKKIVGFIKMFILKIKKKHILTTKYILNIKPKFNVYIRNSLAHNASYKIFIVILYVTLYHT